MSYVFRVDGVEHVITSEAEIEREVGQVLQRGQGEVWLLQKVAPRGGRLERWAYRILGLSREGLGPGVGAFFGERGAVLLFVDADWNESVAVGSANDGQENERVSFQTENGQQVIYRVRDLVDPTLISSALGEFFRLGTQPKSVRWRKSK